MRSVYLVNRLDADYLWMDLKKKLRKKLDYLPPHIHISLLDIHGLMTFEKAATSSLDA